MSSDEAEKAAKSYATGHGHGGTIPARLYRDIVDGLEFVQHVAFLAGVEWEAKRSAKLLIDATNSFGHKEGGE